MNSSPEKVGGFMGPEGSDVDPAAQREGVSDIETANKIAELRDIMSTAIENEDFSTAEEIEKQIAELRGEQVEESAETFKPNEAQQKQIDALAVAIADAKTQDVKGILEAKRNALKAYGADPIDYTGPRSKKYAERHGDLVEEEERKAA